mmetsp:Transcript_63715/g.151873  ORF Transcript_63715/g.151873 Transcript_63715/m.151873 type:complete len:153 (-) Transcript_63715:79-537(-)
MPLSILPYPSLMVAAVQYLYPLRCCLEKFPSAEVDEVEYVQWTVYWAICALWLTAEQLFLWILVEHCPLYLEAKMLVLLWLSWPTYRGAAYLWYGILQPLHKALDDKHYELAMSYISKVRLPDVLGSASAAGGSSTNLDDIMADNLKGNKSS